MNDVESNWMRSLLRDRTFNFFLYCILSLLLFRGVLASLVALGWNDNRYSQIIVVPFLCLALIWLERRRVFSDVQYQPWAAALVVLGVALYFITSVWSEDLGPSLGLLLSGSSIVLTWIAGFILIYGARSARAAVFPLGLLLFAIPAPPGLIELAEVTLQKGSAEVTHVLFQVLSIPVHREGLVFSLPGVSIEVAKECSGIRSAIALLITALLLSYIFLRSNWRRACCILLVVPIAIFKNAIRIAMLSWLAVYVSQDYLTGNLHHRGGILFSTISIALLLPVIWLLRRGEDGGVTRSRMVSSEVSRTVENGDTTE